MATGVALGLDKVILLAPVLAVLGTTSVIAAAILADRRGVLRPLRRLGELSLPIYIVHLLPTVLVPRILLKLGHVNSMPVHIAAGMLVGLGAPLALVWTARRLGIPFLFSLSGARSARQPRLTSSEAPGLALHTT
jgi:peptidoglycan/LPS O-acetylase OafA/YrhL